MKIPLVGSIETQYNLTTKLVIRTVYAFRYKRAVLSLFHIIYIMRLNPIISLQLLEIIKVTRIIASKRASRVIKLF